MELRGTVRPDRPLLVVALPEEANGLGDDLPVLVTGPGKVNAAVGVATTLAAARPAVVVNLGTAGGLHDGLHGIHDVSSVIQHDFDAATFRTLVERDYGLPIALDAGATGSHVVLATGDRFVAGGDLRRSLSRAAHLVDMEGYAVAWAARAAGVPVRLIKLVSDDAGEGAVRAWTDTVAEHSRSLARWARREFFG